MLALIASFAIHLPSAHASSPLWTQYTTSVAEQTPLELTVLRPEIESSDPPDLTLSGPEAVCSISDPVGPEVVREQFNQLGAAMAALSHPYSASCFSAICRKVKGARPERPKNFTGLLASGLQEALKSKEPLDCKTPTEGARDLIDNYLGGFSNALRADTCTLLAGALDHPRTLLSTLNYLEASERHVARSCYSSRSGGSGARGGRRAPELPDELKESRLLTSSRNHAS